MLSDTPAALLSLLGKLGPVRRWRERRAYPFHYLRHIAHMQLALSRGTAARDARRIDPRVPATWEFRGFSQNGEDGVLEQLVDALTASNRCVIEIGASDGTENNAAWLCAVRGFEALLVEADPEKARWLSILAPRLSLGVECRQAFVTAENVREVLEGAPSQDPDVFSLDIDGNDWYVARALLEGGFRPRIWVVEYNSAFGPTASLSVRYNPQFRHSSEGPRALFYGASVGAWKALLARHGYRFVTVDANGVNAFFVDPAHFRPSFLDALQGAPFEENVWQRLHFRGAWEVQRPLLEAFDIVSVD